MKREEQCVILTDRIRDNIHSLLRQDEITETTRTELNEYVKDHDSDTQPEALIPFKVVRQIYTLLQKYSEKPCYLHELLEGSEIHLSKPPNPDRNPELDARIQRLKAEQENREYKQMTKGIDLQQRYGQNDFKSFGQEIKELNKHLMAAFNFLVTVAGAFAFGYVGCGMMGNDSTPSKLITGSALAFVVFVADMYFLIKNEL